MILMQMGNTGQRVAELQTRLNKMANFNLKVDGIYGAKTRDAVTETQRSRPADAGNPGPFGSGNPPVTGSVDDDTWAYIVRQSGPVVAPSYPTSLTPAVYKDTKGASVSTENSYIQTGSGEPGPAPAPEGLLARMKRGFTELEPWKRWAVIGGGLVATLFAVYAVSTKKSVSLSGFVGFLNDEDGKPEKCNRTPPDSTLREAEDILPEA